MRGLRSGLHVGLMEFHLTDYFRINFLGAPNREQHVSVKVLKCPPMTPKPPKNPDDLTKVKTWLEKPEQAEILSYLREMIRPTLRAELHEEFILKKAQRFLRSTGYQLPGER